MMPDPTAPASPLKVALVCPGVGQVRRGYERFMSELFDAVKHRCDATLFKAGGRDAPGESRITCARRTGLFSKLFPIHALFGRSRYHAESLTFTLSLARYLYSNRFDLLHCIDPPLLKPLDYLRRCLGLRYRILFSHAGALPFPCFPRADHVHHLTPTAYQADLDSGSPREALTFVPVGVRNNCFDTPFSRAELRRKHGIPEKTVVILSISAINRAHKRVDYLVDEVSRLSGDWLLWIDGSLDTDGDESLMEYARKKLGDRCRITHMPSDHVGHLFKMADIKVLCSLVEGFGLAAVEAMTSGLPVLTHNTPHFEWLIGDSAMLLDMSKQGALTARLQAFIENPAELTSRVNAEAVRNRFSWSRLGDEYIAMYHAAAGRAFQEGMHTSEATPDEASDCAASGSKINAL